MYGHLEIFQQGQNLEKNDLKVGENGLFRKKWQVDWKVNFPLAWQKDINDDGEERMYGPDRLAL